MANRTSVKIIHGALDEMPSGDVVLRGVIDPESYDNLQVPPYQREILPASSVSDLYAAIKAGRKVPDIELAMRGHRCREQDACYYLQDAVFIMDGLQRITAGQRCIAEGVTPRIGATIHFGTTEEWEREQFRILNFDRTRLATDILLRNLRGESASIDLMYGLSTTDGVFPLFERVKWQQRMKRTELMTAVTLVKTAGQLHRHLGSGGGGSDMVALARNLDLIMERVGPNVFRDNLKSFFEIVEQAWGIRRVTHKELSPHLRAGFLWCLARVFSDHENFWGGGKGSNPMRLFVERPLINKLHQFPVSDPGVANLAGSGGKSRDILYDLIVRHVNSGKRTKRLANRYGRITTDSPDLGDNSEEAE